MPRPFKTRFIASHPGAVIYKPAGVPARTLDWVSLSLDEFEAIRLLDHEGLDQERAAEKMGISRPTVTRIYASARKKIADVLVLGQALRVEGGPIQIPENDQFGPGGCGRGFGRRRRGRGWSERP